MMTIEKINVNGEEHRISYKGLEDAPNYLPNGITIRVEADGSGDFATINEAVNYLNNKISDGQVTIRLGEGNFIISEQIKFNGYNTNIPEIRLIGAGIDKTIISTSSNFFDTKAYKCTLMVHGASPVLLQAFTLAGVKTNYSRGIQVQAEATCHAYNIKLTDFAEGAITVVGKLLLDSVQTEVHNSGIGLYSYGGLIYSYGYQTPIVGNNVQTFMKCTVGGQIKLQDAKLNLTNCNTTASPSIGTFSKDGFILGTYRQS